MPDCKDCANFEARPKPNKVMLEILERMGKRACSDKFCEDMDCHCCPLRNTPETCDLGKLRTKIEGALKGGAR